MSAKPNQFHLENGTTTLSYFPDGQGPISADRGRLRLTYQDADQSREFFDADVRVLENTDLATIVSVTLERSVDTGSTTLSLLVPDINLPDGEDSPSAKVHTHAVVTKHRALAGEIGHPQTETFTITSLHGTAVNGIVADVASPDRLSSADPH